MAVVLTSSNARAGVPSAKNRFPVPNRTGETISTTSSAISCGRQCSASLPSNSSITLQASPDPGFVFVNWTGACTGTAPTCTVRVTGQTQVQANFKK